ncbi:hypothetical protein [Microscilla marina]|uniref:Uncharacterized protein n=1 Tax=Microscilla marina ATCC 23134 TaxID=313606 RepID=A1ZLC5_MICM2|nr:hypothetical protein [Microscilla marina]EAY28679.1 hypothetical protein M23134_07777 [Microscilla marina ATCC 23134]
MINILEFLQTGVIQEVIVGMSKDVVFNIISDIDDEILMDLPNYHAYLYEGIELIFYENVLETVNFKMENKPSVQMEWERKKLMFSYDTSIYDATDALNKAGIIWEFYQPFCIQKQIAIMTEGEVLLFFSFGAEGKMEKIQRRVDASLTASLKSRLRTTQLKKSKS